MSLLNNIKVTRILVDSTGAPASTGFGVAERVLDMNGWDGVLFIGEVDSVTAAGIVQMWPMHSDSTSTTDMVSCTDAAYVAGTTASTTDHDEQVILVDVFKPVKRYVSCYGYKLTQASKMDVTAIQYRNRLGPITQSTGLGGVIDSALAVSPTT
jgi:hypothetical protein